MAKDYNRQACRTLSAEKGERLKGIKMKFQNEQAREKNWRRKIYHGSHWDPECQYSIEKIHFHTSADWLADEK